jgi:hypothetical protein
MLSEQFEIALAATGIRTPVLMEACRAVLVTNQAAPEIARKHNISLSGIYRATASIRRKWQQICSAEEWDYIPLAVPRAVTPAVLAVQIELLRRHREKKAKRSTRARK